ncbi:MAG: STAS domain-containing protein, partial [Actinobacteria bacterium]|nr:STAS domain-containing protein [Actinomycetota bacterium]
GHPVGDPVADGSGLGLSIEHRAGRAVIAVTGELDLATVDDFAAAVEAQLPDGPVLLDLSGLSFMDSSGVRILDSLVREVDRQGWTLRIGPELQPGVSQVLAMTGMLAGLPIDGGAPPAGPAG